VENAGIMGVPIPGVIAKAIDMLKQKSEGDSNGN
jgi:phage-related holin